MCGDLPQAYEQACDKPEVGTGAVVDGPRVTLFLLWSLDPCPRARRPRPATTPGSSVTHVTGKWSSAQPVLLQHRMNGTLNLRTCPPMTLFCRILGSPAVHLSLGWAVLRSPLLEGSLPSTVPLRNRSHFSLSIPNTDYARDCGLAGRRGVPLSARISGLPRHRRAPGRQRCAIFLPWLWWQSQCHLLRPPWRHRHCTLW